MNALAHDLNYPALRKNKNIEAFLNRCKSYSVSGEGQDSRARPEKIPIKLNTNQSTLVTRN